ncbi:hypothetical protein BDQ12DRAFT_708552 [Crucibulum laeve]|uniref:Uncharacterized protein n=1 Tax=Crucibulum laeve TaxID=68775 RepID=A0A5C3MTF2_9AGAR|nr:hypothetical protein BDQ12DRAFT_708552 [Crucibulum laeve]
MDVLRECAARPWRRMVSKERGAGADFPKARRRARSDKLAKEKGSDGCQGNDAGSARAQMRAKVLSLSVEMSGPGAVRDQKQYMERSVRSEPRGAGGACAELRRDFVAIGRVGRRSARRRGILKLVREESVNQKLQLDEMNNKLTRDLGDDRKGYRDGL